MVPDGGRTVQWIIAKGQLEDGLREMVKTNKAVCITPVFQTTLKQGVESFTTFIAAFGLVWHIHLHLDPVTILPAASGSQGAAGLSVRCRTPWLLGMERGLAYARAQLDAFVWQERTRRVGFRETVYPSKISLGSDKGWSDALRLQPATSAAAAAAAAGGGDGGGGSSQREQQGGPEQEREQRQLRQQEAKVAALMNSFASSPAASRSHGPNEACVAESTFVPLQKRARPKVSCQQLMAAGVTA